ncbi:potassium transporter [Modestobacter sp. VKM Ac-2676]|nr:potassium transporter [Modestobacter sp. VKM Ac-2676]
MLGLGRFGTALALELARGGTEVLAVDNRPDIVQRLSGQLGQVVIADSTDADALTEIGIADFGRVVVAIGSALEASILTTALLAELEVPDIWAKAVTRPQATILSRIGAHHVVFPEQEMGERIAHLVAGRLLDWVELDPQWVFARTKPPKAIVGVPLGRTGLRKKHHVTVVSVKPENTPSYTHADHDTVLTYGAEIVIAGRPADVERFVELQ